MMVSLGNSGIDFRYYYPMFTANKNKNKKLKKLIVYDNVFLCELHLLVWTEVFFKSAKS